ncbi:RNA-guided endonuclease TnpB family protein [Virgibacillus necropolis]|uniref:Transposase n=1 Tax=Virgibacillus necropolis TaxID=163877 RepID=A0A221MHI8_9BACI|nr:RNA-guided endonuclease TnpB family protein [Virgibacillus necropolis]ASN07104.1 transposase [Virgibacillus necropolis]
MKLTITAKIKILPTELDKEKLLDTIRAVRKGLNFASKKAFRHDCFTSIKLHKLTYNLLRSDYRLKSQMANSVARTVCAKYKSMQSNDVENTLAKFKKPEYDLVWNRDYSLKSEYFSVNTLFGRIKVPYVTKKMEHFFDGSWKFGTSKLVQKKGKYFLHIPMTKELKESEQFNTSDVLHIVGIDLGINFVATVFDDAGKTTFFSGKQIKQKRAHYKLLRKQLQQRQTPSARRRLKAIGQRENCWMTDVNHVVSKALVTNYGQNTLYTLEDLQNVRKATEKVCKRKRYVSVSWAFDQLREFLTYKAQMTKSKVILVNPKYTSQDCPKCEHRAKNNRNKKTHQFCCKKCAYRSNDDRVAAMNLYNKGIKYLSRVSA